MCVSGLTLKCETGHIFVESVTHRKCDTYVCVCVSVSAHILLLQMQYPIPRITVGTPTDTPKYLPGPRRRGNRVFATALQVLATLTERAF